MSRPSSGSTEHRSALPEGTKLHNYVLERVLGAGGFGITYMAREPITERKVAIKEYLPSSLAVRERDGMTVQPVSETTRQDYEWGLTRFRQEATLLMRLRHSNIVPSLNYFEANGTAYLVMEYQEGQTLSQVTAGATALEESEVRELLEPLLDGVEAVHKAGLLHRDIKPDNIFIRNDGTPVLIDFGSARQALGHHSQSLTAVVTDGYAPFEQYERGGDQGPWTDIYAVGAVLFRALVGHRPPTSTKRLSAQYKGAPDPAAQGFATLRARCSKQLARAIEGALMVNAEDRPQSIADFRALLADSGTRATVRRPEGAVPTLLTRAGAYDSGQSRASAPVKRRRALPIYAGLAALLLGGGAAAAYLGVGGIDIPGYTLNSPTEAAQRLAAEEAKRKAIDEARRRADEEMKRRADADAARQAEEEAKRRADAEAEAKRRADAEAKRRAEEEAKRRADAEAEAKRRADAEAKRRAEEEAKRRADAEAEAKRRAEEEAKRRAEEEAKRRAEEEAKRRADAEAARRADEDAKRRAEEEAKRRADEEAKRRADAEAEAKRRAEEERLKAAQGARPSWYAAERNRGLIYFAHKSALIEPSAYSALERLIAAARSSANFRITLVAAAERHEGVGPEAARLRAARLQAIRAWLVDRGIPADRIRIVQQGGQGEGAEHRFVSVSLEGTPAIVDRPGTDRPGTDRPGTDRPGTSEPERRYSQAELTLIMYRLLKGAAMSTNIKSEGEQALSSGSDVSALAVCVNWAATTPEKASINGAYMWNARSGAILHERALRGCQNMSRPNCECVVIDVGGGNALRLPPAFAQKYARQ
jgi:serine/threonine protein kinase